MCAGNDVVGVSQPPDNVSPLVGSSSMALRKPCGKFGGRGRVWGAAELSGWWRNERAVKVPPVSSR